MFHFIFSRNKETSYELKLVREESNRTMESKMTVKINVYHRLDHCTSKSWSQTPSDSFLFNTGDVPNNINHS